MGKIFGTLEKENREVALSDNKKLDCEINVGSAKDIEEFVKVWVGKDDKSFKSEINVYCKKRGFELFADTRDDRVIVNSLINALKDWLEEVDYEEMFGVLEELKGLEATLSTYLEDISRVEE